MDANRAIALLVALAILLAGPVSQLMATGECCCRASDRIVEINDESCCGDSPEPTQDGTETDQGGDEEDPCSSGCDCPMPCCTAGKTMPLNAATSSLELPDDQPDAFEVREPESHAIEPHFSLLRPPQA